MNAFMSRRPSEVVTIVDVGWRRSATVRFVSAAHCSFEKKRMAPRRQACCNRLAPISFRALFVFLHLLKSETECIAKFFLAHTEHHAPHAHAAADVSVDGVGGFGLGHFLLP